MTLPVTAINLMNVAECFRATGPSLGAVGAGIVSGLTSGGGSLLMAGRCRAPSANALSAVTVPTRVTA